MVLLDVKMTGLDGYETAELIRSREKTRQIPIIFLTSNNKEVEHVAKGYSHGAVDYLFKPFPPEILRSKVDVFVELAKKTIALTRQNQELERAKKELAEAWLTLALVRDQQLPGPDELKIDIAPYCNGLAEAASELRRQLLDQLRGGDLSRAESLMSAMDDIYSLLVTIDYPDGVTGGLRRTTDALRAVLERTRGDITTATVASRLQGAITSAQRATGA